MGEVPLYSLDSGVVFDKSGGSPAMCPYRGTSLIRNRFPLAPYSRPMPRALWWS